MKIKTAVSIATIMGLAGSSALAETTFEYAQVIESQPIYRVVEVSTPEQQCWEEELAVDRYS